MATLDQVKKAIGVTFVKDLSRFEPGAKGIVVGETLRIHDKDGEVELCWLLGTPPSLRQPTKDRLRVANIAYTEGPDFKL